ncbi:MAG: DUF2924 domain-containing protein [Planctomycetes bacterium]|nr:DUF2924 domain-containing protein [Planctomycetota bacterium]
MTDARTDLDDLQAMTTGELLDAYVAAWGKPPRVKRRDHMIKRVAWKREEARTGGLSKKARDRLEELIAELDLDLGPRSVAGTLTPARAKKKASTLPAGTTLRRPWKGRDIVVRVLDQGFEHEGETYRSLSAIAKAVTGSHWNGRHFFGLTKKRDSA